jgi:hypothetical protein
VYFTFYLLHINIQFLSQSEDISFHFKEEALVLFRDKKKIVACSAGLSKHVDKP